MKLLYFIFLTSMCIPLYAVHAQEQFLQANLQYEHGNYEKAAELYSEIKKKSGTVWYNLGNCYFHLERTVDALACWKRAQKLSSGSLWYACKREIATAESTLGVSVEAPYYAWLLEWQPHSLLLVELLLLFCWYLLFTLRFFKRERHSIKKVGTIALSIATLSLGTSVGARLFEEQKTYALVSNPAPLLAGPQTQFDKITTAEKGKSVTILTQDNEWCKVSFPDGTGWIQKEHLIII